MTETELKLAFMTDPPPGILTLEEAVTETFNTQELMDQYRRLSGSAFGLDRRTPIERMVDQACGVSFALEGSREFFEFVRDCVWWPVVCVQLEELQKLRSGQIK